MYRSNTAFSVNALADIVSGRVQGDGECLIRQVSSLTQAGEGDISFVNHTKYIPSLRKTQASAVIVSESVLDGCAVTAIVVKDPHVAYALIATALYQPEPQQGIHPTAVVGKDCRISDEAWIGPRCVLGDRVEISSQVYLGPGCVVGSDAVIGSSSRLLANVTVMGGCQLGQEVLIHAGAVIGSDGFGLANNQGEWVKVPQLGRVIIGNHVEIGANSTIDRGALEDTILADGVKLDNQVHVAHNVQIGQHTAIAGCVGIAGSAIIGEHCTLAGGAVVHGHLEIVDHVHVGSMCMVTKSIKKPGQYASGLPADEATHWRKNITRFKTLDDMARRLLRLEKMKK